MSISIVNNLSLDAPEGGVVRQMPYCSTPTVGVTYYIYHISYILVARNVHIGFGLRSGFKYDVAYSHGRCHIGVHMSHRNVHIGFG